MRYRALVVTLLALCFGFITACSEAPSAKDLGSLTYEEILNTGLANSCIQLDETARGSIGIDADKSYSITDLCLEPTTFFVKEEPLNKRQEAEYVPGKSLTRYTSSLDQVNGNLLLQQDGSLTFQEKDGIDFQAITVQLPGGEQVPFLFTIKGLVAQSQPGLNAITTSTDFEGDVRVPSYRTSNFLDPKGRGLTSGYDNAVALPARADAEEILEENVKQFEVGRGHISLQVSKVDSATGEIAGTFESVQPSDTDMGAKEAVEVKIRGLFYGRVDEATTSA
jgi:photosystem II oxygen-evolving enhancer protein 1